MFRRGIANDLARGEGHATTSREPGKSVVSPAVAEGDRDREDARPVPSGHAIEIADQLREEVVGVEFLDDRLQERARPGEPRRA